MNPGQNGWLKKFLDYRNSLDVLERLNQSHTVSEGSEGFERSLYQVIQPTGLMYGHPVQLPYLELPKMSDWGHSQRMKVILTESIINSALIPKLTHINPENLQEYTTDAVMRISEYYSGIYPEIRPRIKTWTGRWREPLTLSELVLNKRTLHIRNSSNYWSGFFHNSLLFLDVYYFGSWYQDTSTSVKLIREQKDELSLKILKMIAVTARSDRTIAKEERNLYRYYLQSTHLSGSLLKEAKTYIDRDLSLNDVGLNELDSYALKKYFLELAILTTWADQVLTDDEQQFLVEVSNQLGFAQEELQTSLASLESFVLGHWQDVHYLQKGGDFQIIRARLMRRIGVIMGKNKDRLGQEIRESRELVMLLNKSRTHTLTAEEREKVRVQLMDILKIMIPVVIIALPFTFITLPVLLKVLPKSAFPTSFRE